MIVLGTVLLILAVVGLVICGAAISHDDWLPGLVAGVISLTLLLIGARQLVNGYTDRRPPPFSYRQYGNVFMIEGGGKTVELQCPQPAHLQSPPSAPANPPTPAPAEVAPL